MRTAKLENQIADRTLSTGKAMTTTMSDFENTRLRASECDFFRAFRKNRPFLRNAWADSLRSECRQAACPFHGAPLVPELRVLDGTPPFGCSPSMGELTLPHPTESEWVG